MSSDRSPTASQAGLRPGGIVRGEWRPEGSKSLAQRALLCAALAHGETRVRGLPDAEDVLHALALIEACGVRVQPAPPDISVVGRPPGPDGGLSPDSAVDLGESGTLARLATAVLGLAGQAATRVELAAAGSLLGRRSSALFATLAAAGVAIERDERAPGDWPVTLTSIGPPSVLELSQPSSSQEVSGLLMACAAWPDTITLRVAGEIPSAPYLDMTLAVLADFGVQVATGSEEKWRVFEVPGPLRAPESPFEIEPDASSAAVALAAACLSGGELLVPGLTSASRQGDVRIVEHLASFGCRAAYGQRGLVAAGRPSGPADLDLTGEPDLAPVLAAVGAAVALEQGPEGAAVTRLTGLGTLPGKESSRIEVLREGLVRCGLAVEATVDSLTIGPARTRPGTYEPVQLDAHGDHRMAFAFALLGLVRGGVDVIGADCVSKSWPGFWKDMRQLGAQVKT